MSDLSKLRWRCRRGMREMDILLQHFLDRHYLRLDAGQQAAFAELLNEPDQDLLNWILGRSDPPRADYVPLIELLRMKH
jgi:antitoxin CptB